jgi:hypothetical protein
LKAKALEQTLRRYRTDRTIEKVSKIAPTVQQTGYISRTQSLGKKMSNALRLLTFAILSFAAGSQSAWASDYPSKAIRWIVPYPPGGTTDVLARIMAQRLTETLGQPVVVENKPGAGNNIGTELVIGAPADGYTMLLVNPANGINASLYKNLSYNFIRDIAPVAFGKRGPLGLGQGRERQQKGGSKQGAA